MARRGSPLHTHDTSGIIHIESETDIPFTLGQFFTEWDESLTATQVGPVLLTPFETVRLYVNGKQVPGDPAAYQFCAFDQIAVIVGPPDAQPHVPASDDFPSDLSTAEF
ncbi:hypothetical protein [Nocardia sp. NPDC057440]|uniref:hypothetical protein n=1 Tax=Nocardia sp. NPDC057440 TaxID=3346134 RepID=UPI00367265E3